MLWAALLGGGLALLVGGLAGASKFLATHFPSGMSLVKYNLFPKLHRDALEYPMTCAKTGSPVERINIIFVPGVNMVVLSSPISAKLSKMSCQGYTGFKWQCFTTQSPTQQHSEP